MVVTAALIPEGKRIFVAQRPPWKKFGLLWEFPGGKVEIGEELEASLIREIREELCLEVVVHKFFRTISYSDRDFSIDLHVFWCAVSGGQMCLREHVAFKWAYISELKGMRLTEADRLLIPYLEGLSEFPRPSDPSH